MFYNLDKWRLVGSLCVNYGQSTGLNTKHFGSCQFECVTAGRNHTLFVLPNESRTHRCFKLCSYLPFSATATTRHIYSKFVKNCAPPLKKKTIGLLLKNMHKWLLLVTISFDLKCFKVDDIKCHCPNPFNASLNRLYSICVFHYYKISNWILSSHQLQILTNHPEHGV